jgi:hypothetical protein
VPLVLLEFEPLPFFVLLLLPLVLLELELLLSFVLLM